MDSETLTKKEVTNGLVAEMAPGAVSDIPVGSPSSVLDPTMVPTPSVIPVYIASFFDTRERLLPIAEQLNGMGYYVTSRWLTEAPTIKVEDCTEEYFAECAVRDVQDVSRAAFLIVDTLEITPRGGREVEYGIALAQGKPLVVVGPKRNVFHRLAAKHFDYWEDAIAWLRTAAQ